MTIFVYEIENFYAFPELDTPRFFAFLSIVLSRIFNFSIGMLFKNHQLNADFLLLCYCEIHLFYFYALSRKNFVLFAINLPSGYAEDVIKTCIAQNASKNTTMKLVKIIDVKFTIDGKNDNFLSSTRYRQRIQTYVR